MEGESGTGKELAAHVIHRTSGRGQRPFMPVACKSLMKGISADGYAQKLGEVLRAAEESTLFLDEVCELPAAVQSPLAVLPRECRSENDTGLRRPARVVAVTHRVVKEALAKGQLDKELHAALCDVFISLHQLRRQQPHLMVRIPYGRLEMRLPDGSCNPYLASAAILAAGMDGVDKKMDPGPPNNTNLYEWSSAELKKAGIGVLPQNLNEALDALEEDKVLCEAIGRDLAEGVIRPLLAVRCVQVRERLASQHDDGTVRRDVHVAAQIVDHAHFVAALSARLYESARGVKGRFARQDADLHCRGFPPGSPARYEWLGSTMACRVRAWRPSRGHRLLEFSILPADGESFRRSAATFGCHPRFDDQNPT